VFFLPIHWAVLIGLAVSIAVFLRRVSELHLFEMVAGDGQQFVERSVDDQTGRSAVTMLQIEGPLFFAHADELADRLRAILRRDPTVLIIRMRRTKHVDFSVLGAMDRVLREYLERGGRVVICGLQPGLRAVLRESPLGETIPSEYMLETTREVFGSAHMAIALAENIARLEPGDGRPLYRVAQTS
jgi:SulP family sulfate permease